MTELKDTGIVPGSGIEVGSIARYGDAVPVGAVGGEVRPLLAHAVLVRAR
jgi:hypothetical protein